MVFETLKEFLTPKHFSKFGFTVILLYIVIGAIFSAVQIVLIAYESKDFVCDVHNTLSDKNFVRLQCYEKYKEQYSPFPLLAFTLLSFGIEVGVCVAYSVIVKSRVEKMEAMKPDPENPRPTPREKTYRVFGFYFVHLLVRLVIGISSSVSQKFIYPSGFPTAFNCTGIKTLKPTTNPVTNSTDDPIYSCHSSSQNAPWAEGIWIINIIFVTLVLAELIWLGFQVNRKKDFIYDLNFCKQHLNLFNKTPVLKTLVKSDSIYLEPLITNPESEEVKLKLNDIFVDVLIYTGRGVKELENWKEQHEIFRFLKPRDGADEIELKDLFINATKKILIVGCPGIGKSVLCSKLIQDLKKGKLLTADNKKRFEYLFSFQFKSFIETEKVSLRKLLRDIDSGTFQDMLDNSEKVLLVFDGLEEFKDHSSLKAEYERAQAGSATEEMPFSALYANLLKGNQNLLPGATVLTTCRPNELQSVKKKWFCRIVEIVGFTKETVENYITKYCNHNNIDAPNRMWRHVSTNVNLLSLCYIPVICCIICGHLKWLINNCPQNIISLPTRLTQVYEEAIKVCIFTRHLDYKGKEFQGTEVYTCSDEETLSKLGSLGKTGIKAKQEMFGATEVHGMENCGLLHCLPDSKISSTTFKKNFCFIQFTFQKFLAAREIAKMEPSELSDFITSNASDPKWHLVIQFVAGLLCGKENEAVNSFVSLLHGSLTEESPLRDKTKQKALLMMKCLYEYNNETTVENAACELQKDSKFNKRIDLSQCQVTPFDCTAIVYFIKHLELNMLNLSGNEIGDQGVSHLCDVLNDVNCKLTKLDLKSNKITDDGVSCLCADGQNALINCKLTKLDLSNNKITHRGVSWLCDALKDVNCELTVLNLSYNHIGDKLSHLHDALKDKNCKLTKLYLSRNKITDQGVKSLCDALQNENCRVTKLNLSHNKITVESISYLCGALKNEKCKLTKLYLRYVEITEQSVSDLCEALKDENSKLTELDLNFNNIADQGVSHLCDALKHINCNLAKLDLSENNITDKGVSHLCDALKYVNCKLTKLRLSGNNITDQGVSDLRDALKDVNCKLTKLRLSGNKITDQGVSDLCDALKRENCKLTKLRLSGNEITDQGVSGLCDALKCVNCKLTKLDLSGNKITDQGVSCLRDALKDVNCKLTKLYLGCNNITGQGVSDLCDALKCVNCKLTDVKLESNRAKIEVIKILR